jgi:peptidoglycan hydrolase CwlO-like protein
VYFQFDIFAGIMNEKSLVSTFSQDHINQLEEKINVCATQLGNLQQRISEIEKKVGEVIEKFIPGIPIGTSLSQVQT